MSDLLVVALMILGVWFLVALMLVIVHGPEWRAEAAKATGYPVTSMVVMFSVSFRAMLWPHSLYFTVRRSWRKAKRDSRRAGTRARRVPKRRK